MIYVLAVYYGRRTRIIRILVFTETRIRVMIVSYVSFSFLNTERSEKRIDFSQ